MHVHISSKPPLLWLEFHRYDIETFVEALGHLDWDTSINQECCSLIVNNTWDLVPLPNGINLVKCKWVYINKYASNASAERHKAKLGSKGFLI